MPLKIYNYNTREFPHCGLNNLDCDDQVNPVSYNDLATSLNRARRLVPRIICGNTSSFPIRGQAFLDFELAANDPDYLIYCEFQLDTTDDGGNRKTGNVLFEFGIFANPAIRQAAKQLFVSQADYLAAGYTIVGSNPEDVGNDYVFAAITGSLDPSLKTTGQIIHGFLRVVVDYPGIPPQIHVSDGTGATNTETGEVFATSGIKALHLYTGEL